MQNNLNKSGIIYLSPDSKDKSSEKRVLIKPSRLKGILNPLYKISTHENKYEFKDGTHSFVFWLVVPFIILWLTVGYIVGLVKENPSWFQKSYASGEDSNVQPFSKDYPNLSNKEGGLVTLWFDDAWLSQYMIAYPILKEYGFPDTIAVSVNSIETKEYVNWAQLRVLQINGWETTNHGRFHDCTMQNWDQTRIDDELKGASLVLWKNNLTSDIFVTPCGVDSPTLREEARKNFLGYRTVNPGFNSLTNLDFYQLKVKNIDSNVTLNEIKSWLDYAKESSSWLILVFHKIGESNPQPQAEEFNTSKEDFTAIVDYIKTLNLKVIVPNQLMIPTNS